MPSAVLASVPIVSAPLKLVNGQAATRGQVVRFAASGPHFR